MFRADAGAKSLHEIVRASNVKANLTWATLTNLIRTPLVNGNDVSFGRKSREQWSRPIFSLRVPQREQPQTLRGVSNGPMEVIDHTLLASDDGRFARQCHQITATTVAMPAPITATINAEV